MSTDKAESVSEHRTPRSHVKPFALVGVVSAVLLGTGMGIATTHDVRAISNLHVERVTVVSEKRSATEGCGKSGPMQDFRFESSNPPAGLPAVFALNNQCLPTIDQGDKIPFVREVEDGKVVKNWVDPTVTYRDAIWTTLASVFVGFIFMFGVCWIGYGFRRVWVRFFWHD